MKKINLILHFGVHRTGTTTIQGFLKQNANKLIDEGFLYPHMGFDYKHVRVSWGIKSGRLNAKKVIELIDSELSPNIHTVILSHEDFSIIPKLGWLKRLKDKFDVKAVFYLRRQDEWLESWYNQHIKWPWMKKFSSATPEFFLDNISDFFWINYLDTLDRVSDVLGSENIYYKAVGEFGVKDTLTDFRNYLSLKNIYSYSKKNLNSSLTACQIQILRNIDLSDLRPDFKAMRKILIALRSLEINEDDGSTIIFSDEQVEYINKYYERSNNKLSYKYFSGMPVFTPYLNQTRNPIVLDSEKIFKFYIPELVKKVATVELNNQQPEL